MNSLRFLRAMLPFVFAGILLTMAIDHPAQRVVWLSLATVVIIIAVFLQRPDRPRKP
jgi:hypothetical protein